MVKSKRILLSVIILFFALFFFYEKTLVIVKDNKPKNNNPFEQVLFTGRFDFSNPSKVYFSNPGCLLEANFDGTGISASFASDSQNPSYFLVVVDGNADPKKRTLITITEDKPTSYVLVQGLPSGKHRVELVKETEYNTQVSFYGFSVENGNLINPPEKPPLKLEFYGDSNAAGMNVFDPMDQGLDINHSGYYSFPFITARMLNAECSNISMSGVGMTDKPWRNLFDFYNLINMDDVHSGNNVWNFRQYTPDAVVINLSSNDYPLGATKEEIKTAWKKFVSTIRSHYPNAHIVIAESYGLDFNEPADYLAETIEEIHLSGDSNVSYVKFPWLWGCQHATISEHVGFANILAKHLATVLNLPQPISSTRSSFAPYGTISNGSFETSTIPGFADGWRPEGSVELRNNGTDAKDGTSYINLYRDASARFANSANPGDTFTLSAWVRGNQEGDRAILRIEFNDQGRNAIYVAERTVYPTSGWQQFTITGTAPQGTWAMWAVLVGEGENFVSFDDVKTSNVK